MTGQARPGRRTGCITSSGYRLITAPDHPLANPRGRVYEHRQVLYDRIGPGVHLCHWCRQRVAWLRCPGACRLYVDHLNDIRDDNRPENLVPACNYCNTARGVRPNWLTHCKAGHRWTPETLYVTPDGERRCKVCRHGWRKAWRERQESVALMTPARRPFPQGSLFDDLEAS
jgi:hypothetical protein